MATIHLRMAATVHAGIGLIGPTLARSFEEDSTLKILAAGRQAMLERHLTDAVRILRQGLNDHSTDNRIRFELGRAYLATGEDGPAIRLFREILREQPADRATKLELARALGFRGEYRASSDIYLDLLGLDTADESAAIGLASNFLHQKRASEASAVVTQALLMHPDSVLLQEYKDRLERGKLGGEERAVTSAPNLVEAYADYFHDSNGNHAWRSGQRMGLYLRPGLTSSFNFEEDLQYRTAHTFEAFETSTGEFHWRAREWMAISGGAGAVRFNDRDVQATYQSAAAFQLPGGVIAGGGFSRSPNLPNAESTEHKIIAQGWETFARWNKGPWHVSVTGSRQHYSDQNLGTRETAEGLRDWRVHRVRLELGYRYRRYAYDNDPGDGYFAPASYQSHLAQGNVHFRLTRYYRGEVQVRGGFESSKDDGSFNPAWEINVRNELILKNWTMQLNYEKCRLVQDTGAYRAETGQFEITYHFR